LLFHGLNFLFPFQFSVPYASRIYASDQKTMLHAYLSEDEKWRFDCSLNEISPLFLNILQQKEDNFFYYHPGVNPFAITRAMIQNTKQGKRSSGASTISMQIARLLKPKPRTIKYKLVEMFRALQLELRYNKHEILNLYCNLIPYGGNIEGIGAAAILYLQKEPKALSLAESVLLAIIPNRPTSLKIGQENPLLLEARNEFILRLDKQKQFPNEIRNQALEEPIAIKQISLPNISPHLCRKLHQTFPNNSKIYSSIHPNKQLLASNKLKAYVSKLNDLTIYNGCVMIIDNNTREVVAYVGSQDFSDNIHAGQVDGTLGIRSPGSTLKPLIYAIAIDKGILTPKSILYDVPMDYDGYKPRNFNKDFNGPVTLSYALTHSLNIPAVTCLKLVGTEKMNQTLAGINFTDLLPNNEKPGLALALGGCGTNMQQLIGMYAALANNGKWAPLVFTKNQKQVKNTALVSPTASKLITQILLTTKRPDFPNSMLHKTNLPKIAWKTGTSFGRKDAWSIGYNQQYTIAVWIGNFNGNGVPDLNGGQIATPLLFELFADLHNDNEIKNQSKESVFIENREVCVHTGRPPNHFCNETHTDSYIPGISNTQICNHLLPVFISTDSSLSFCRTCLPNTTEYITAYYPDYPIELLSFWQTKGMYYKKTPPHYPYCKAVQSGSGPYIQSISNNATYLLDGLSRDSITLTSIANADVQMVYWFDNDELIAQVPPHKPAFWKPQKGKRFISVVDDKGRKSVATIHISFY